MRKLDEQTLEALAELICGDGDSGPLYRKGWELPLFFRHAGLKCPDHDGSTRKWWALDRLRDYNESQAVDKVILRLASPREYRGNAELTNASIDALNKILAIEGLRVDLDGVIPLLLTRKPGLAPISKKPIISFDALPNFDTITQDSSLATILGERWLEAQRCVNAGAHVAAVVMMGSLLEGALLAIITANPKPSNCSKASPKDKSGRPLPFQDWNLNSLIDVAHECGWIQIDVKRFSHVLRDYRNIVHPWEQRAMQMTPDKDTCAICWEVVRAAVNDLAEWHKRTKS